MSRQNIEAFRRATNAINRGELDAVLMEIHPEIEFIPLRADLHGPYRGHDGVREFVRDNAESLDLFQAAYPRVRDLGERVLAFGTVRVRGKGSGAEAEVPSALVLEFREGRLVHFQDFGDRTAALAAVGMSE